MLIYKATNKINDKSYIGQTVFSLKERKGKHVNETLNKKDNIYFHNAMRKYGFSSFTWKTLHANITNVEDLNKLEIFYIGYYNTFENGYNLTEGGGGSVGYVHSKEIKKKMSEGRKGMKYSDEAKKRLSESRKGKRSPMYGKKHSEESKRKMSESMKGENHPMYGKRGKDNPNYGRILSEGIRKKMSESTKGEKHPMYGKHHPISVKRKMSEAKKGMYVGKNNPMYGVHRYGKESPAAIPVIISNKYFDTRKEAAEYLNVSPATVRNRIKRRVPGYQYA